MADHPDGISVPHPREASDTTKWLKTAYYCAGYWDIFVLRDPALEGIEILRAPDRPSRSKDQPIPRGVATKGGFAKNAALLAGEAGQAKYGLGKATVEPVFGQIKGGTRQSSFTRGGFERASSEWKLICATHNLLKLFRSRKQPSQPKGPKGKTNDSRASTNAYCKHKRSTRRSRPSAKSL